MFLSPFYIEEIWAQKVKQVLQDSMSLDGSADCQHISISHTVFAFGGSGME